MFHDLSQFFSNNPWLNILFLFLAVFSIVLTLIFYYRSKKEKIPSFSKRTINIIENSIIKSNNLEVKYNGAIVESLSMTEFAFWNAGRETIKGVDIVSNDPLVIKSRGHVILYGFEISFQKKVNNFKIQKIKENCLNISFDFIDVNQGIKLKLYHNGSSSSSIEIEGTIMGANAIKRGIKKGVFAKKMDIITVPINFLINSKYKVLKVVGFIIALAMSPILVALSLIIIPLDTIYEKIHNAHPKEFLLND